MDWESCVAVFDFFTKTVNFEASDMLASPVKYQMRLHPSVFRGPDVAYMGRYPLVAGADEDPEFFVTEFEGDRLFRLHRKKGKILSSHAAIVERGLLSGGEFFVPHLKMLLQGDFYGVQTDAHRALYLEPPQIKQDTPS